ncbi:hypothetical protein [Chitinophaga arvensicola]|uniref:Uncharacterized protein n=1 Tax=Chitinophaga arvensicola TaxID=29529 RepID=A0A1I0SE38_9BACT|nr:hypothetical protein [Chitinophaga arvensicola]SEW57465.1 hypothetical protein SAMN04488122_6796 [Chitinophaga arvensicola]
MSARINFYEYYGTEETILQTAFQLQTNGGETFYRANIIENFGRLRDFYIELTAARKSGKTLPENRVVTIINDYHFELIPDYVKICIFFENFVKAELLRHEYLIHSILKTETCKLLSKLQGRQPVSLRDLHCTEPFVVNSGKEISHNSLGEKTLSISTLLSPGYQKVIQLPSAITDFVCLLNKKRNILHLYNSLDFDLSEDFFKEMANTISFVNVLFYKDKDSGLE